jgi:DNA processing protein
MQSSLFYQLALSIVPHIGPTHARKLLEHYEPEEIFKQPPHLLEKIDGIGAIRAKSIHEFKLQNEIEKELEFIDNNGIYPIFITDQKYPHRLLHCLDAPIMLYYKGDADLNAQRMIAVVGTRLNTDYGKQFTKKLIQHCSKYNITVISGMAYGIDAIAHSSSLKFGTSTIGVLAHGLNEIYPPKHKNMATEMLKNNGGLLTEFRHTAVPDKFNFIKRNRIVAGMTDATIVIESHEKGGSLITASLAESYNREVFAIPGRISDNRSKGCNELIKNNKAIMLTDPKDITSYFSWESHTNQSWERPTVNLSEKEKLVLKFLSTSESTHIDQIRAAFSLKNGELSAMILNLELEHRIVSLPGNFYKSCL